MFLIICHQYCCTIFRQPHCMAERYVKCHHLLWVFESWWIRDIKQIKCYTSTYTCTARDQISSNKRQMSDIIREHITLSSCTETTTDIYARSHVKKQLISFKSSNGYIASSKFIVMWIYLATLSPHDDQCNAMYKDTTFRHQSVRLSDTTKLHLLLNYPTLEVDPVYRISCPMLSDTADLD